MPDWREYASEVWRDGFATWERGERLTVFAGVVLGSLLLGILLALGVAITIKPVAGLWVSAGLLAWLILLVLVVSPYRVWARERKKTEALEEAAKKKINVDWRTPGSLPASPWHSCSV